MKRSFKSLQWPLQQLRPCSFPNPTCSHKYRSLLPVAHGSTTSMNAQTYIFQQSKRDSLYSCGTAGLPAVQPVAARLPKGADDRCDFQESEKKERENRAREDEGEQGERKTARSLFDIYFFHSCIFSLRFEWTFACNLQRWYSFSLSLKRPSRSDF